MTMIGIRIEDKYLMEKRVAITPNFVKELIEQHDIEFEVESSPKRVFTDEEYRKAGAKIVDRIKDSNIIFGVKEMPSEFFEEKKTYLFFSHTIKGQDYNMDLLRKMVEKKINLIEFEKITDDNGKRLIFFGRFAGLAGMINSFWSFGQRCKVLGYETPFSSLQQSYLYSSIEDAISALSQVAKEIKLHGLPAELAPLTIGITGNGNVSKGAQEIINLFENKEITPSGLLDLKRNGNYDSKTIYKIIFNENDLSVPLDSEAEFELQHYYKHPEEYKNDFERYVPEISILMNCMFWSPDFPRIITKDFLKELFKNQNSKLCVIGDVTCDPDGSIEATHIGTYIEDPVFVYNPENQESTMGFEGDGVLIMAVDILPAELPRESSLAFSKALSEFIPALAKTNFELDFDELNIPMPFKRALILHQGEFTPDYEYMKAFL